MNKSTKSKIDSAVLANSIEQALQSLKKERDRFVISKRNGIGGQKTATLESIGQQLGVTRERVRQIEKATLNRLREQYSGNNDLTAAIGSILATYGDIIAFDQLGRELEVGDEQIADLAFLVKLTPSLVYYGDNDDHEALVSISDKYTEAQLKQLHDQLVAVITKLGKPMRFEHITKHIDGPHAHDGLEQLAQASKLISCYEQSWGLSCWPEVNPKSIRDKAYLVLKKVGRPMHFSDIAKGVIAIKSNNKTVTTQAVHNELIKDTRFVLIGRGIYALKSWGYDNGTVSDIITQVLADESPLTKDEIVRRVLVKRQVKPTTVVLNLQEKPQFERVGKATYRLKTAA